MSILKTLKQRIVPRLCAALPASGWHKLLGIDLVIPHWHVVSDETLPHISGLYQYRNIKQFNSDIDYFLKVYQPVSLQDILDYLGGITNLPKCCFMMTFDDGFREIHDVVAPILLAKGIPATFFLTSATLDNKLLCYPQKKSLIINAINAVGSPALDKKIAKLLDHEQIQGNDLTSRLRSIYYSKRHVFEVIGAIVGCDFENYVSSVKPYLSIDQVKYIINKGFSIGAHSKEHPHYSEITLGEQVKETLESIRELSDMFQFTCKSFAFPYGDANITPEFFQSVFAHEQVQVTFGIGGVLIMNKDIPRHLPRFSMERTDLPAEVILSRQYGRSLLKRRCGR